MKKKKTGGFTLVELIIVIAILGILAGLSVPVYTGYIQKAKEAADLQLLEAVNTAFAAACAERGKDPKSYEPGELGLVLDADGKVMVNGIFPQELRDAFLAYFGDNADKTFSNYTSLFYNKETGKFVGTNNPEQMFSFRVTLGGQTVYLTASAGDIAAISGSEAFGNKADSVSVESLMTSVNRAFGKDEVLSVGLNSEDFHDYLRGITSTEAEADALLADEDKAKNLLIMYVAQNTDSASGKWSEMKDMAISVLGNSQESDDYTDKEKLATEAMVYGLATAYRERNEDLKGSSVSSIVMDTCFQEYLDSPEGQADIEGYKSCMSILSENFAEGNISREVIETVGVTDDEVIKALNTILGRS